MTNKEKSEKSSHRLINPRLIRGILAVIAAILIWFYINGSSTELVKEDILNIPVNITGISALNEKGLYVTDGDIQYYVNLNLRGSEKNLKNLNASSFTATVDLSDIETTGTQTVDIVLQGLPNSVILDEIKPSSLSFEIEEYTERKDEVKLIMNGQPEAGYTVQCAATDQKVTLTGLSTDLGNIAQVSATVTVTNINASTTQKVRPAAYDSSGNPINTIKITPAEITVQITAEKTTQ